MSEKWFTFVKLNKNGKFSSIFKHMETKDRIKSIMEDQKMTQQEFANFLQQAPATLSSIFTGRTRPTLNVVDAIKAKIPDINIEWLLYGVGDKYISSPNLFDDENPSSSSIGQEPMIPFETSTSTEQSGHKTNHRDKHAEPGMGHVSIPVNQSIPQKEPRRVTEIRVYYDDQTFETFVPAKK